MIKNNNSNSQLNHHDHQWKLNFDKSSLLTKSPARQRNGPNGTTYATSYCSERVVENLSPAHKSFLSPAFIRSWAGFTFIRSWVVRFSIFSEGPTFIPVRSRISSLVMVNSWLPVMFWNQFGKLGDMWATLFKEIWDIHDSFDQTDILTEIRRFGTVSHKTRCNSFWAYFAGIAGQKIDPIVSSLWQISLLFWN